MHSALELERKEDEEPRGGGGGSNSLKRKFCEIDEDQPPDHAPDCSSSPTMIDSNGSYELNVYEVAKKRNVIALLGTGTDKPGIINMLIKAMASDAGKRLIIFLASTVKLVKQQCCEIRANVNLKVEEYFGAKGVDKWTSQRWEEEVSKHDVLVMTPQILLDALRSAFLKLEMVCLLVIDECHRTTGNHPYAKIMKEFYHKSTDKPKIFGLMTPAAIRKDQVSELESLMDAQILNPEEQEGVEKFTTTVTSAEGSSSSNTVPTELINQMVVEENSKYKGRFFGLGNLNQSFRSSRHSSAQTSFDYMQQKLKEMDNQIQELHERITSFESMQKDIEENMAEERLDMQSRVKVFMESVREEFSKYKK